MANEDKITTNTIDLVFRFDWNKRSKVAEVCMNSFHQGSAAMHGTWLHGTSCGSAGNFAGRLAQRHLSGFPNRAEVVGLLETFAALASTWEDDQTTCHFGESTLQVRMI